MRVVITAHAQKVTAWIRPVDSVLVSMISNVLGTSGFRGTPPPPQLHVIKERWGGGGGGRRVEEQRERRGEEGREWRKIQTNLTNFFRTLPLSIALIIRISLSKADLSLNRNVAGNIFDLGTILVFIQLRQLYGRQVKRYDVGELLAYRVH